MVMETGLQKTLNLLKKYEGFRDTVYLDGKGIPTIGYGFTDPELIKKGKITRKEADARLTKEIATRYKKLQDTLSGFDNLSDDSKAALISYHFNYPAGFKDTTKFMQYWKKKQYDKAINEVDAGMNDEQNPGLRTRRLEEQSLLRNDPYFNLGTSVIEYDGNKRMVFPRGFFEDQPKFQPQPLPEPAPKTIYPLSGSQAPQSLSSWNSPDAPNAGVRLKDFNERMNEITQDDAWDTFNKGAVATGRKKQVLPRISDMLDYGKEKYFADLLGVPSLYDQSNQPGYYFAPMIAPRNNYFADGKTPHDTDPIFVDKGSPDAKWHENWLNNRTQQLEENYNINPQKFDKYGTGSVDQQINNLKSTKEYRGVDNVNKEYGYDFPMGYLGHNIDSFTGGVTITGEGNDNNIIMYPSATLPPESNPQYIMPDRTQNGIEVNPNMTDQEIEQWNNGIKRRAKPKQDRYGDMIHERTHALSSPLKNNDVIGTLPQDYKIDEINKRHGLKTVRPKNTKKMSSEEYHMIPNEIYAGLNEARYKLGLSPDHVVTKEEIQKWKKEGQLNQFLEDKPDDVLLEYFNEVASNPNPLFNPSNVIQAYGMQQGKLLHARDGKLPGYEGGLVPGLGKPKKLTIRDIKVSPGEPGLQTIGPMEEALIAWLGGRAVTSGLSMYNRARAFKQAKETYRQARQWNEQTRDASRAWKIADADKTARNSLYSGSNEPLGWLYDTLLRPAINAYDKLNQSPIGILLP